MLSMKKYFSQEKANNGRQPELDIAKGLAIVFMVWSHVFEELSPDTKGVLATLVRNIFGGPFAAPVFMVCLGVGIAYSRNNTPRDILHRGVSLLKIGLLLNLVRYVLPDIIKYALTNDITYLYATFSLFSVDILQFAGLAFVFFAVTKKLKIRHTALLLIGVIASVLGMLLRWVSTGNYMVDQFVGFFWGTNTETYFPFLNWIIFPIAGFAFGSLMRHCKDKKRFYLCVTPFCAVLMIIYLFLTIKYGFVFSSNGSYYFLGLMDAVFFILLALMFFGLYYAIIQLLPNQSFKTLIRFSKNTNNIFCIHWSLLGLLGILRLQFSISSELLFWQATLIMVVLLIVSDRLALRYIKRLKPKI